MDNNGTRTIAVYLNIQRINLQEEQEIYTVNVCLHKKKSNFIIRVTF